MSFESLSSHQDPKPVAEVMGLYRERGAKTEGATLSRVRSAMRREAGLFSALKQTGFELGSDGLKVGAGKQSLELPSVPEQVSFVQELYGDELAKRLLEPPTPVIEALSEVTYHGFEDRPELQERLDRYVQDVLPSAWGERLRSIRLEGKTPRSAGKLLSHQVGLAWEGQMNVVNGQAELMLAADASNEEIRRLCGTLVPDVLANLAVPALYLDEQPKTRVEKLYLASQAMQRGIADELLPGLAAPRTPEQRAATVQAYEAALVRLAWSTGEAANWTSSFQRRLVELYDISPQHAQLHTALAKYLLPYHLDEAPAQAFADRQEWSTQWARRDFEEDVEQALQGVPDPLSLALQDRCLHFVPNQEVVSSFSGWQPTPEVPVEGVPFLEEWQAFLHGVRSNLLLHRPVLDGLSATQERMSRLWSRLPQGRIFEGTLDEAHHQLISIFA